MATTASRASGVASRCAERAPWRATEPSLGGAGWKSGEERIGYRESALTAVRRWVPMGWISAHVHWIVVGLVALSFAILVLPRLVRSSLSRDASLSLCGLYLFGIAPTWAAFVDPTLQSAGSYRISQTATLVLYALALIALVGAFQSSARRGSAYWTFLLYCLALVLSALLHTGIARNLWVMPLGAFVVTSVNALTVERLVLHLRWIGRIITGLSLYLAATDYASVQFTDNDRSIAGLAQLSGATPHPNVLGAIAASLSSSNWLLPRADAGSGICSGFVLAAGCLLLAQSHAGWFMAGFGLAILLIGPRAIKLRIPGVGIVLVSFAVVGLAAYRAMTIPPGKSLIPGLDLLDGRTKVWNLALQPFHANPWLGEGARRFRPSVPAAERFPRSGSGAGSQPGDPGAGHGWRHHRGRSDRNLLRLDRGGSETVAQRGCCPGSLRCDVAH